MKTAIVKFDELDLEMEGIEFFTVLADPDPRREGPSMDYLNEIYDQYKTIQPPPPLSTDRNRKLIAWLEADPMSQEYEDLTDELETLFGLELNLSI